MNNLIFDLMFIIVPIFIGCGFIFTFAMILSPKLRGKFMSRQLRATKYMIDESKDDLTDIASTASNALIKAQKNILDDNEEILKDIVTRNADIYKEGIKTTTKAIKDGLTKDTIFCKHCGKSIDEDSKYCKYCGEQL